MTGSQGNALTISKSISLKNLKGIRMQQYTIAFNFVVESSKQGMTSSLQLTGDESNFSISDSKNIQVLPYRTSGIPSLTSLSLYENRFSFASAENSSGETQSLKIVLPIVTSASSLTGNLPFPGMSVQVSYQFVGYSAAGNLDTGDFSIPFPV